ncbi:MAG: glycosyltransferase [Pirellulales bacterium]|nr:glycosyltransferase [Pirellulales bacterium]
MPQPRIVLITRRFWPLVGGAEMVMANLAVEFRDLGCDTQLLTAKWESQWPNEIIHRDIPVSRLSNPRQRGWGTYKYMHALAKWLRTNKDSYDAILVSMLKHDAYVAVRIGQQLGKRVVLRVEGAGETGDCNWHTNARFGMKIRKRCMLSDHIIGPSDATMEELLEAGFDTSRTVHIPNGVGIPEIGALQTRTEARQIVAEANYDLTTTESSRIVIYTGRLDKKKGLVELIRSWPQVLENWADSQLWLIGEGPDRDLLYQEIKDLEVRSSVFMPGAFDDVTDLLRAANLFVLPSYTEGLSLSLLEAMAHQIPVVASDIPGNRQLVTHGRTGRLVPVADVTALGKAIISSVQDDDSAAMAAAAYSDVKNKYSIRQTAQSHLSLLSGDGV